MELTPTRAQTGRICETRKGGAIDRRAGPNVQVERRAATDVAKQEAAYRRVRSNARLGHIDQCPSMGLWCFPIQPQCCICALRVEATVIAYQAKELGDDLNLRIGEPLQSG